MCVCLLDIHYLANTAFSGGLHDDHIADYNNKYKHKNGREKKDLAAGTRT